MTSTQFLTLLKSEAKRVGSQKALANQLQVQQGLLSRVLNGRDAPPPSLLKALGFERVVSYRRVQT